MRARILYSLILCTMLGCGSHSRAPVEDRNALSRNDTYVVVPGDTLYSIAFRSGLDFRKVAVANGISAPYTIYPGQQIVLKEVVVPQRPIRVSPVVSESSSGPLPAAPSAPPVPVPVAVPSHGSSTAHVSPAQPVVAGAAAQPPLVSASAEPAAPVSPAPVVPVVATPPELVKPATATAVAGDKVETWLWPTAGPVARGYSQSVHKGIDIGGARGDPVVAVAPGNVVYSGTGIVGFGELLIIKHNEEYLSAYGHNDRLLVTEGQTVTAGQAIAEKGSSGTDTVKLHFEIRREGKPIDPQKLLPPR